MRNYNFSELVNVPSLQKMSENLYAAAEIPIGIIGVDGEIYVKVGWQEICTKFHRMHPDTANRCFISDNYINKYIKDNKYAEYKCLNNMWDIAVPIVISGKHLATIFLGQFFYEDEIIDLEFFRDQALNFGFDEEEYLNLLNKVPKFSREKVKHITEYYLELVKTLGESGLRQLEYENAKSVLEKNQKYTNIILNSVSDSIIINDFTGNILFANNAAISMFGYTSEELLNMNAFDVLSDKTMCDKAKMPEMIKKAICNNSVRVECICKTKNNHEFWTEINISAIVIDGTEEVLVTLRDITDRKLSQLALEKEAQEMEVLRTEFFANISHELRTPLNIIFSVMQIMKINFEDKEKPINREKFLNDLNIGNQNCFRLLRLINNLIDSTKIDSGYFELNMANCNIISIVEEITLSVAEYIKSNNLSLVFDTDVEEKIVACDPDKIERIMLNLLSNSIKFTPSGGKIFVNVYDSEDYVTIVVEDTGIGIPNNKLKIIFDRFRQVDKSFVRSHEGSGIGLSLVKSLVEMHGGSIFAESNYGMGSKFIIKLPVKVLEDTDNENRDIRIINAADNYVEKINIEFSDIYNFNFQKNLICKEKIKI